MGTLSLSGAGIISVCHHAELTCFGFFVLIWEGGGVHTCVNACTRAHVCV